MLAGGLLTFFILAVVAQAMNTEDTAKAGMTFFEQPGDVVETHSVEVFQALNPGTGLAHCKGDRSSRLYLGTLVLLYNSDGTPYFDDQVVKAPAGKCFRQVGIYRYSSEVRDRTVPIVTLSDK